MCRQPLLVVLSGDHTGWRGVLHYDTSRVPHRHRIGWNIGHDHTVDADNGALAHRHALQDEGVLSNPGVAANTYGLNLLGGWRQIGNTGGSVPGMGVGIHEAAPRRDLDAFFENNLLVHDDVYVMAYVYL